MVDVSPGARLQGGGEEERRKAASLLGSASTEAKAAAARENGRRGGRPKGTPMSEEAKARIREGRLASEARKRQAQEAGGQ